MIIKCKCKGYDGILESIQCNQTKDLLGTIISQVCDVEIETKPDCIVHINGVFPHEIELYFEN